MEHRALGRADPLERLEHGVVRVAVVDLHRDAVLLRERDVRLERLRTARGCRPRRCGRSRGPSRRSPAPAAARRARRSPRSPRRAARPRRTPAPRSGGWRRRRARAGGMPRPPPTTRSTRCRHPPARRRSRPTAAARSSCSASVSGSSPSAISRCAWLSYTGTASGSGASGQRTSRLPSLCRSRM